MKFYEGTLLVDLHVLLWGNQLETGHFKVCVLTEYVVRVGEQPSTEYRTYFKATSNEIHMLPALHLTFVYFNTRAHT